MSTSVTTVSDAKLKRIREFISWLGGGELSDALMSLFVAYDQRGTKIEHLKDKLARGLEQYQERP